MILPLLLLSTTVGISTAYYGLRSLEDPAVHHILERIVIEEAKKINRTADEHAAYCLVRLPWQLRFTVSDEDELALRMELNDLRRPSNAFNSSDEMMLHFQKSSPIGYSIYEKLNAFVAGKMKEYRFGQEAITFVKSMEQTQLYLAAWGYKELTGHYQGSMAAREGRAMIRKAVSAYLSLSETAKNDLEKMWCIRTFYQTFNMLAATGNIYGNIHDILRD